MTDQIANTYRTHHTRPDLGGEHRLNDLVQAVLFLIFMAVWALDVFHFHYSLRPLTTIPPLVRNIVIVCTSLAASYLAFSGLKTVFGEVREKPAVIRTGVFRLVRHPIYLAAILFYFMFLIMAFSQLAAAVWVIIVLFYYWSARYEERLLIEKFGDAYRAYIRDVPMFIPGFRK
ncbi:isoprenylcysteine carboxylmethyltransferase family protein [bacterium]|nr:isoprenylcysteine carboxylmethyltransferase family protein [bacterium]